MAFHIACGEGGMAKNLDQFGPALKLPWTRLDAPELTPALRNAMVDGCNDMAGGESFKTMASERDQKIARILKIAGQKS
jgi:carnitine 3-dehydrogenase